MGTIIHATCYLSWKKKKKNDHNIVSAKAQLGTGKVQSRRTNKEISDSSSTDNMDVGFAKYEELGGLFGRRAAVISGVVSLVSSAAFGFAGEGLGVVKQGLLAGRIPGLSEPDKNDLGDNTTIEAIGSPEKVINAFGPEVIGENVEGKVLSSAVVEHLGRKYYQFELEPPHVLITATAAGNRLYLFSVTGKGLQWKRYYKDLKQIADSFRVN